MKLAEALVLRADVQKRLAQVAKRAVDQSRFQEGEEPAEDANELMAEHARLSAELERLIVLINKQNLRTEVTPELTMTAALARRDVLVQQHRFITDVADAASSGQDRYAKTEIRYVPAVNVRTIRKQADELARAIRELDTSIQAVNWMTEIDI